MPRAMGYYRVMLEYFTPENTPEASPQELETLNLEFSEHLERASVDLDDEAKVEEYARWFKEKTGWE